MHRLTRQASLTLENLGDGILTSLFIPNKLRVLPVLPKCGTSLQVRAYSTDFERQC